jgi:hypothetical protein
LIGGRFLGGGLMGGFWGWFGGSFRGAGVSHRSKCTDKAESE